MPSWLNSSTETSLSMKVCLLTDMLVLCEGKYVMFFTRQTRRMGNTVCQWVGYINFRICGLQYSTIICTCDRLSRSHLCVNLLNPLKCDA